MSVPPDQMGAVTSESPSLPRFDLPEVDTEIDTGALSAASATQSDVATLSPPQDINAATIADYTPYQETLGQVNPESTVEGRLGGLLSQNNPYIDRARTQAAQTANRRGMLNTSMAAGAAEGAAIDRALPIAQQDARANLEQQFLNQGYSNEAAKHLADSSITRENLNAGFLQDTNQFNAVQNFEANKLNQSAQNTSNAAYAAETNKNNFAVLSAELQGQLKGIDSALATSLETLTREYGLLENMDSVNGSIYQQMIQEMGTILANEKKASVATAKINALIASAGVEMSFSSAMMGAPTPQSTAGSGGGSGSTSSSGPWGDRLGSCFTGDTLVQMADNTTKEIADVLVGDIVLGMDGAENVVTGTEIPTVGARKVFSFNDGKPFVTHEHPFMTSQGWKSLSPHATKEETHNVKVDLLMVGDYLVGLGAPLVELDQIDAHTFDPETPVYNLFLAGNNTYYANGYLVHNKGDDNGGGGGGGGGSGGGGSGGGGGDGCFSGDTCFRMANGGWKQIKDIQIGDELKGGKVTAWRSGPSDRDWYDYRGSRVTDEHFVFEGGTWMYVKDSKEGRLIEPRSHYYTVDTTEHQLHGVNGAIFSDDAVFDLTHYTHQMPYGKEQWDLQLKLLNEQKEQAA